jgi:predicted ATPase
MNGHAAAAVSLTPIRRSPSDEKMLAFLRDKRMLIVLDSCEHLVEAAAGVHREWRFAHARAAARDPGVR